MSLILRNVKGSPLTWTEMDDNLTYLEDLSLTEFEDITYIDLMSSLSGGTLEPNTTYHITDSSQGDIWIKSLDADTLSTEIQKLFYVIPNDYYVGTIGEGVFNAYNPVDVTVGEIYIWGARLWECTASATGVTQVNSVTLPAANFTMIPTSSSAYNKVIMSCQYDIDNDWISKAYDWKGNELGIDYSSQSALHHIDMNDWGDEGIHNNVCGTILNNEGSVSWLEISNNKGYYGIWNNDTAGDGGEIISNICGTISGNRNGYFWIFDNIMEIKYGEIKNNIATPSYYGNYLGISENYHCRKINNNSIVGDISRNILPYGEIRNNSSKSIMDNIGWSDIVNNSNDGDIIGNVCLGGDDGPDNHFYLENLRIENNSNNGHITNNKIPGSIANNYSNGTETFHIFMNSNNGWIVGNVSDTNNIQIRYNNNNGNIGSGNGGEVRTTNIEDTQVDK